MSTDVKFRTSSFLLAGCLSVFASNAHAEPRDHRDHRGFDPRESRAYAPPGSVAPRLPRDTVELRHGGGRYRYHSGSWYAPRGPRWVVVAPPFGIFVPMLPGVYSTLWWGGVPYYYANDVYYVWRENRHAYEVVPPPEGPADAIAASDPIIYPREGQDDARQAEDRYQCHRWASDQTHFDPTKPGGGVSQDGGVARSDYLRAISACLEGRGYSVK